MIRWLLTLGLVAGLGTGCASGRVADLRDVAKVSLHGGLGFSVDARVGILTQPSLGLWSTSAGVGLESRDVAGVYFEKRISFPYSVSYFRDQGRPFLSALNSTGWQAEFQVNGFSRAFEEIDRPLSTKAPREFGRELGGKTYGGNIREGAWLPVPDGSRQDPIAGRFTEWTRFELGGQFGIFGGRVGVNPLELVDFLLGFGGIDIAGDDPQPDSGAAGEAEPAPE